MDEGDGMYWSEQLNIVVRKSLKKSNKPYWKDDGKGNVIAEKNDNATTLSKELGITYAEALGKLKEQGYTVNKKGVLNLKVGDKVRFTDIPLTEASHSSFSEKGSHNLGPIDSDGDGRLDSYVYDDAFFLVIEDNVTKIDETVVAGKIISSLGNALIKKVTGISGSFLSTQSFGSEKGALLRRDLGLRGNATQRQIDSSIIMQYYYNNYGIPIKKK